MQLGGQAVGLRLACVALALSGIALHATDAQKRLPSETVREWARTFAEEMRFVSTRYSGYSFMQKKYKDYEKRVYIEEMHGLKMVRKLARLMEDMLSRKTEAVKRLVEAAEEADLKHEFNSEMQYDYYNAVFINDVDEEGNYIELAREFILEPNAHFNNLAVNTSLSNVQVPTNVYNKEPNIVNGAFWSEALNPVFEDNFERDATLTWQYYGSSTGFFRQYPGIKWTPDENGVISFDCRNRGWYIQAATSPKDIVILVDVSGSMKGLRLTIAKQTISTILDTLGDNDFVNVIAYNEQLHYIEPCFEGGMVQANRDNREHFKQLLEDMHAQGVADLSNALEEGFVILDQFNGTGQGSICNQALMVVTDGAVETFAEVFEKYNSPDKKVRIFTYLIGREQAFAKPIKWMACANKGYYTQISTLADVQENVMEYLHVLSRPMVINHDHDIIWTEAYMDSTLPQAQKLYSTSSQGLLLMTTVAMPVFSKKNETRSHGILLGVVGTDVPLKELLKMAPRYKLGVHGYAFIITNNGYIVTHPDLRPMYKEGKKMKPKPNYNSVDLSEVEWEDVDEVLRTAMVNRQTGTFSMEVKNSVDDGRRVLMLTNDYFFTALKDTPFSLGVVLSRGHGEYVLMGNVSKEEGLHDLLHPDLNIASDWIYCNVDIDPDHRKLTQLEAVRRYLLGIEPDLQCDDELLQEVLFDAVVTAPLEAYWTSLVMNKSENVEKGIEMAFLGTRAGLTRTSFYIGKEKLSDKDFLTKDQESVFTMDHFPIWYRRAAEQPPGTIIYTVPYQAGAKRNKKMVVTASVVITVTEDVRTAVAAAVGIQIKVDFFRKKFLSAAKQPQDTDCSAIEGRCPIDCEDPTLNCYIVDDNGFVIVSKNDEETGEFFGVVDGAVMSELLSVGAFIRREMYDYQAMCKRHLEYESSAFNLLNPYHSFIAAMKWIVTELAVFFMEFNVYSWWYSGYTSHAKTVFHSSHKHRKHDILEPCDTTFSAFITDRSIQETNGILNCGCRKTFVMQQIPYSNLMMVVVDGDCECTTVAPMLLNSYEIKYNESVKCDRMRSMKVRRRPDSCHAFHPDENAKECGGAMGLVPFPQFLLLPAAALCATWR
ncbi:voltage-dependent calcium channel subunit alpha-2/delta-3-like [Lethenteron reissneri]|uniref:voltage-dependent calcium channel subunit alpha-2/delta-3-like n=1 Tax=Lethenteron reissneri TaxID=7753 RepID=UPI002AB6F0B7|nr:voltage-dependent calcium channel subunit alpha-2/delta-3-like [Lethenteron reissneri]